MSPSPASAPSPSRALPLRSRPCRPVVRSTALHCAILTLCAGAAQAQHVADEGACLLGLLGRRRSTGADRPDRLVGDDDVAKALGRHLLQILLDLVAQLRENSQIIQITHQKRTMEVGDALYGVTMRGDGVSAVISQRLREQEPA